MGLSATSGFGICLPEHTDGGQCRPVVELPVEVLLWVATVDVECKHVLVLLDLQRRAQGDVGARACPWCTHLCQLCLRQLGPLPGPPRRSMQVSVRHRSGG